MEEEKKRDRGRKRHSVLWSVQIFLAFLPIGTWPFPLQKESPEHAGTPPLDITQDDSDDERRGGKRNRDTHSRDTLSPLSPLGGVPGSSRSLPLHDRTLGSRLDEWAVIEDKVNIINLFFKSIERMIRKYSESGGLFIRLFNNQQFSSAFPRHLLRSDHERCREENEYERTWTDGKRRNTVRSNRMSTVIVSFFSGEEETDSASIAGSTLSNAGTAVKEMASGLFRWEATRNTTDEESTFFTISHWYQ